MRQEASSNNLRTRINLEHCSNMSNYTSAYPTGASYDPSLTELLEAFYKSADLPPGEDQEVYVNSFTEDAILQIGDKINARGRDGA